ISAHEGTQSVETDELITEGVTLHLENGAQYAFNDAMRESDTQYLSSFLQWDLKLGRLMDGVDYASYMEQYDGEASSDTYTMYRTSANGIDFGYRLSLDSMGEEGADHADIIFQPEYFYCSWTPEDPDNMEDPLSFSCSMDNGRVSEAYLSYGYREESVDTYGSDDEYADVYREAVYLDYDYTLEDGFGRHAFGLHVIMDSKSLVDGEVVYTDSTDIMFDLSANGRAGENGGAVTGVEMDICVDAEYSGLDPTRFEMDIAFDVRTEAGAYADSFAGANIIAIENEDDIPPQMTGEGMMLASQLALLQYDKKIAALPALLEKAVTENVEKEEPLPGPVLDDDKAKKEKPSKPEIVLPDKTAEPSAQIDEGKMKKEKPVKPDIALPETPAINEDELKEKYGLDEPVIDVNAGKTAAEANSFPNLTPPAGYALDQTDDQGSEIFRTYLNAAGDMIDCHIDSTIDDISFGLPEGAAGTPVKLYYHDDGSVYGASFIMEGFYFDIYANPGVSFEEMEAMIASIAF
ncbi:MAG: hypothetical protein IJA26_05500, partial [Clostridia bacterium]|nr:hypothetical protein [Clostridia bacterium]